jgi:hypothetical protein
MTAAQLDSLKADFLKWTGGFDPETDEDVAIYINTSMPFDLDVAEATEALRRWKGANQSLQIGRDVD